MMDANSCHSDVGQYPKIVFGPQRQSFTAGLVSYDARTSSLPNSNWTTGGMALHFYSERRQLSRANCILELVGKGSSGGTYDPVVKVEAFGFATTRVKKGGTDLINHIVRISYQLLQAPSC